MDLNHAGATWIFQAPAVQKVDNAVHEINHYPVVGSAIGLAMTYPLDSDLSGG